MKVVSITGGIGSGKSEVLKILEEEFGAKIIIADQVAHQLMEPGKKGYRRVVAALGSSILGADGRIDRERLAQLIFKDKEFIQRMNEIIHPMAWQEIQYEIAHADKNLVAVEAALFDEEHNSMFDEIWYVYTDREQRIERLIRHRGYDREKCLDIMGNQATEQEFRAMADRVIENNGSVEEIRACLHRILDEELNE